MNDPSTALYNGMTDFIEVVWTACIDMITSNYYLMIYLAGGLIAICFTYFAMAKDSVK